MAKSKDIELASLYVIKLKKKTNGGSFVWGYFGTLFDIKADKVHDSDHVYCQPCFIYSFSKCKITRMFIEYKKQIYILMDQQGRNWNTGSWPL